MRRSRTRVLKQREHLATKHQIGSAVVACRHFDIMPAYAAAPSGLKCFQGSFFRRKTSCIMLRRYHTSSVAVRPLVDRENTLSEPRCSREYFANACNFDNVYADGKNHRRYRA